MDEVRCAKHNTVVECEVVGAHTDPENGPSERDLEWECRCPVGGYTCDSDWFQAKVD